MKKVNLYIVKLEHANDCHDELLSVHSDKSEAIKYASELIKILCNEKTPSIRLDKQVIGDGGYYAFKPCYRVTSDGVTNIKKNNNEDPITHNMNEEDTEVKEIETLSLAQIEKELIYKALKLHKGNRKDAAKTLGIGERTIYRKIEKYKIDL